MTTIAFSYKQGTVAYDSRATGGSYIYTDEMDKAMKMKGRTFLLAGTVADREEIVVSYLTEGKELREDISVSGLVLEHKTKTVYMLTSDDGMLQVTEMDHDMAIGSGGQYAITALDCGLSSKDAVKMAAKRDACTGGKVRMVKV